MIHGLFLIGSVIQHWVAELYSLPGQKQTADFSSCHA
jgi:hypothetical protein